jgi:D-aminopeptidase
MKVFIAVDMEGVAGLVQWDDVQAELQKRLMTEEVNSAARGAFKGWGYRSLRR